MAISRIIPAIGSYVANFLTSLLAAKLSRNDEFEADAYAAALLVKSGIGTDPQISLLKKLDALGTANETIPQWLMSHPNISERISSIEKLREKWNIRN